MQQKIMDNAREPSNEKNKFPSHANTAAEKPLVSIVCVTCNVASWISECIDSIIQQRYPGLEIIVFDGASTDGTQDILEGYGDKIAFWKSEPDAGIYNAMNNALEYIRGQWVYFIGADDKLLPDFSSFVENELKDDQVIYYANVLWKGSKTKGRVSDYHQAKLGIFHQSIIYPASVFKKYKYNTKYKISADYALNLKLRGDKSYRFEYRDYLIAFFNDSGASSKGVDKAFKADKTRLIMSNFGIRVRVRYLLKLIKHELTGKKI